MLRGRREVTNANRASYRRDYSPTTGRVALLWNVTPDLNAYVQHATAADPPSGVLSTASFSDVRNNSKLTTGSQAEIGAKLDFWEGKGNATLALYHIKRKHIATQDPNNSALTQQVGQQSSRGVELGLGLQPTPNFSLQANVDYVDAQYDDFIQSGVSREKKHRPTRFRWSPTYGPPMRSGPKSRAVWAYAMSARSMPMQATQLTGPAIPWWIWLWPGRSTRALVWLVACAT